MTTSTTMDARLAWTAADALARLPGPRTARWPEGERFVELLRRGDLTLEFYAPRGHDPQQPHDRDELYIVAGGAARFELEGQPPRDVRPGDVLLVPAHRAHRFVDIDEHFTTWVVFFGPVGGHDAAGGQP
jgi:mannose-6-phosphate isomerase-like protein (cupin superfamily)